MPAVAIIMIMAVVLILGISESAAVNNVIVANQTLGTELAKVSRVVGKEGKLEALDADKAAALLKKSTPALLDGSSAVDPRHLELVKPGTLYITLPAEPHRHEIPATPQANAPAGMAPVQSLASIDARGKLIITRVTYGCCQSGSRDITMKAFVKKGDEKVAVDLKVNVTTRMLTTVEMPATSVAAHTADGKPLSAEKLATLLAKEQTVLVTIDGKKLDPFLLPLYKEGTIILVPPANTINMDNGVYGGPWKPAPAPPVGEEPKGEDRKQLPSGEKN